MLSTDHKETQMTLAGDIITMVDQDNNFLNSEVTGFSVFCMTHRQNNSSNFEWKSKSSPRTQKFCLNKIKVRLEIFFYSQGIVHYEYT